MLGRKSWYCLVILVVAPLLSHAQESKPVKIIEPNKRVEPVKPAMIDTEKFQLGAYVGLLSVEDFNTNTLAGLSATYQINKQFLVLLNHAQSDVGQSTFERREGARLSDDQRKLSYTSLSGGYKLFTARSFLGPRFKYDTDIYVIAGIGQMDFAGESGSGWSLGASYRIVFTDWMVATLDFRDHLYDSRDVLGLSKSKTRQNLELSFGLNALF